DVYKRQHWRRRRLLIYAGLLACGAIVLMAGPQTPLWRVFYQLPLLNKFRIPARYALLFQLALAILGAVGLDFVVGDARRRRERVSALVWMGLLLIGITWLVHAGYVPRARLQDPWVRVPLLSAAGVWATVWICLVPGLWGRVIAWLVPVLVGCELVYYGYNGITSDVPRLLDRDQCLVSVRAYHARFGATAPLPRVFNCFRNYMAKDRGIGPNRNILMGVPTLDAYGPLYFKVFGWLGHDPSGFYTTVDELLRDNDTLSMLNAVAVAEYDGAAHGMTRQIWEITNALPIVLPALSAWEGAQRYVSDRDGLRLTGVPGLIYTHVPLRSNSVYRFSVDAAGAGGSQPLHVDLFAPGYDDAGQELIIAPFMLEPCVQRYQHVIETGARAPSRALLRVFTFGERAVLVTNVQFEQLAGELRFVRPEEYYQSWGDGLWRNARACPRAWCVSRIIPSASRWAALDWVAASPVMFDPHKEAMVEGIREAEQMSSGNVSCTAVHANRRRWEVEIAGPRDAFLVVSEVWYPGWEAYVDGRRVAYQRVNGLLGGVRVPPGRHSVEVRFRPRYLVHGGILALVGVGLLAVVVTASRRAVNPR
ncbi:MAG: YfhO family protein, partial [bacterium]|nr:YfhO family protein [bacterium]